LKGRVIDPKGMRNNDLQIGITVYWYVGPKRCEGRIIDIYNRRPDDEVFPLSSAKERVLLIEMEDGKKVVKLENAVMVREQQNFG
jgi:hypothetical protein